MKEVREELPSGLSIRQTGWIWRAIYGILTEPYERTDDSGRFQVPVVPGGRYTVQAMLNPHHSEPRQPIEVTDVGVDNLELVVFDGQGGAEVAHSTYGAATPPP